MNRSSLTTFAGLATLAFVAVACSGAAAPATPAATPTAAPTSAALVADIDIGGGRTLHIVCVGPTGTGRPTTILEHGLGADYGVWELVLTALEPTDRVCAYDRAGEFGMSKLPKGFRTTDDQVTDLHALLAGAGIAPPYVLVGHSIGGWNNLVYTQRFPDEVVGAVFVDVRSPAASREWLAALPPETSADSQALKDNRFDLTTFEQDPSRNPEMLDLVASATEAEAAPGFGDRPLLVLTRADDSDLWEGLDPSLAVTLDAITEDLVARMVALSTAGSLVKVADTGHEIQFDKPQPVIDAIRDVLARSGS
ncbi:MAG TPA: alpha/beta hydrolase [Candidatus Eisenbacteria bacterium]|nr:alpha/beta hydrolase [Candidatus Eisenbacteria bacterium]